uniref:Uncharacterized protein n=1 Tax=Opuntia streptacantha TaxID=393608 RepID=A0A7C9E1T5_OPUST
MVTAYLLRLTLITDPVPSIIAADQIPSHFDSFIPYAASCIHHNKLASIVRKNIIEYLPFYMLSLFASTFPLWIQLDLVLQNILGKRVVFLLQECKGDLK